MKHEEICPYSSHSETGQSLTLVACPFCEVIQKEREACALAVEQMPIDRMYEEEGVQADAAETIRARAPKDVMQHDKLDRIRE